ncbi:hypothetical protein Hanom_Chr07g00593401 [Helianthus anomalus]
MFNTVFLFCSDQCSYKNAKETLQFACMNRRQKFSMIASFIVHISTICTKSLLFCKKKKKKKKMLV